MVLNVTTADIAAKFQDFASAKRAAAARKDAHDVEPVRNTATDCKQAGSKQMREYPLQGIYHKSVKPEAGYQSPARRPIFNPGVRLIAGAPVVVKEKR